MEKEVNELKSQQNQNICSDFQHSHINGRGKLKEPAPFGSLATINASNNKIINIKHVCRKNLFDVNKNAIYKDPDGKDVKLMEKLSLMQVFEYFGKLLNNITTYALMELQWG